MVREDGGRRGSGELESALLQALWRAGKPLSPSALHAAVGPELAYNTIHTVLTRMCDKGILRRSRLGAHRAYEPVQQPAEYGAERLHAVLESADDRVALLRRFVDKLTPQDEAALRALLDEE